MDKTILHLCSKLGSDTEPYRKAGYNVIYVTEKEDVRRYIPPENVYGIIANPPCTMFSLARTTAKTPRDIIGALALVSACFRIVYMSKPKFWVIENPQGLLRKYIGPPKITIQPYWFGDKWSKKTDLWGDFTTPKFSPVKLSKDDIERARINNRILPNKIGLTQSDRRAFGPPRFWKSFFESNK